MTEDIAIVANALVGIPVIAITLPIVVVCLGYVGWLSPLVLACGLVVAVPTIVAFRAVSARAVARLRRARAGHDAMVDHFRALIEGFRELKIHRDRRLAFLNETDKAATSSSGFRASGSTIGAPPDARIEHVAQLVAKQVEAHDDDEDRDPRRGCVPPRLGQELA